MRGERARQSEILIANPISKDSESQSLRESETGDCLEVWGGPDDVQQN